MPDQHSEESHHLTDSNGQNPSSRITRSQLLIYVGQRLAPEVPLYNMALAFRIDGDISPATFRKAFQSAVNRCDALRLVFTEVSGEPRQRVLRPFEPDLVLVDFSAEDDPKTAARAWMHSRSRQPFDMASPLFDTALLKIGQNQFVWFLNQHHLITDAWATALLFRQVGLLYQSMGSGSTLPPPPPQYLDFVAFEGSENERLSREKIVSYWKEKHSRAPVPPRLYGKPGSQESTPSTRIIKNLDDRTASRIREAALSPKLRSFTPHLSFYNFFVTLIFAFIGRVSGQSQLALGTPAHNRPTRDLKETIGVCIELFPLHAVLGEEETFASLLQKIQGETGELLRHAVPGASDPTHNRCFNVVLNYINATFGEFAGLPTSSEWIHPGHIDIGHHLRIQVHDFDATGRFALHFDFNDGVFDVEDRETAISHFLSLLEAFLDDAEHAIKDVDIMSEAERTALLSTFNKPTTATLPDRPLIARFRDQVHENPQAPALVYGDQTISFQQLDDQSSALAVHLMAGSFLPGESVGVCLRRSPEMIIAVLAISKAGGAFVPLDPQNPAARIHAIVADASLKTVLTAARYSHLVPELPAEVSLVAVDELIRAEPCPAPRPSPPSISLDDLAYVIYTSGSTGAPKGVAIKHGGIADYIVWAEKNYIRGKRLHFPFFTSLSFDLTLTSFFLPLVTGGTLIIYEEDDHPIDTTVLQVIADNRVDFIKLTPSHLQMVAQAGPAKNSKVSRVVVGGEDFKTALARDFQAKFGEQTEIYNEYGPTEAVVGCMIHRFDATADVGVSVPIGRPADHVEIFVLDEKLRPLPRGVPGELCIARYGLAEGYHGRTASAEDEARFCPHPFRADQLLYRSGDSARFHTDQSLEFLGRVDRQIKVSGFRLEPAEVESALESHPAITAAVVTYETPARPQARAASGAISHCKTCGLPSDYPGIRFDDSGVCEICSDYRSYEETARAYFKPLHELEKIFHQSRTLHPQNKYDCMVLLSGGKDSTYALCRLVDMGLKVYAFTLDNDYLSDAAKANIRGAVNSLGVEHEFASTLAMPDIFRDSLMRFSNVCNGCFKTVYTLSMNRAKDLGIPLLVTGLSRGQFFETRLTPDLFRSGRFRSDDVDNAVLEARKAYHRIDDAVSRSLDVSAFQNDTIFEEVQVVDFYRYCDVSVAEVYAYLDAKVNWVRPADTGRSTNCLINDVGIYIHKKERGYHNYALPYSWDVRMDHKTRHEAIEELDDEIDPGNVRHILAEIGYDENRHTQESHRRTLVAYYQSSSEISGADLREHLGGHLPPQLLPSAFVHLREIPLTTNGKVDLSALPTPAVSDSEPINQTSSLPEGDVEEQIATIWMDVLGINSCDAETSFFTFGGASLQAMDAMLKICEMFDVQLPLQSLFQSPTVRQLAALVEETILAEITALSDAEVEQQLRKD